MLDFAFLLEGLPVLETYFFFPEDFLALVFLEEVGDLAGCTATAAAVAVTKAIVN